MIPFLRVALLDADTRRISKAKMDAAAALTVLGMYIYTYIHILILDVKLL